MRYAIYFAPTASSRWGRFGARWLGRDALGGKPVAHYRVAGFSAREILALTAEPRRYGFHATLKAPIHLVTGATQAAFLDAVQLVADRHEAFALGPLVVGRLGTFLALLPGRPPERLRALASACVRELDAFRAPASAQELRRRRRAGLSRTQDAMLSRWGYPYVLDQWRFHMTLTGNVPPMGLAPLQAWLEEKIRPLADEPMAVDALCVFGQASPDSDFHLIERIALRKPQMPAVVRGTPGRLFYVVGASGSGKDSLLAYAREHLAGHPIVFARRFIDRPVLPGPEVHVALSDSDFQRRLRNGAFAMYWRTNGYQYGIGTDIDGWLVRGRDVVVNGSREYLQQARARYPDLVPIWIEAALPLLRERLLQRGRDGVADIERRMDRAAAFAPPPDAQVIRNEGLLADAGRSLIDALTPRRTVAC